MKAPTTYTQLPNGTYRVIIPLPNGQIKGIRTPDRLKARLLYNEMSKNENGKSKLG